MLSAVYFEYLQYKKVLVVSTGFYVSRTDCLLFSVLDFMNNSQNLNGEPLAAKRKRLFDISNHMALNVEEKPFRK